MTAMFTRRLQLPERSFFLLGPRATGKTTWLRSVLPKATWFDLLLHSEWSRLQQSPSRFQQEVAALKDGSWVVIDEVQRLPQLLNEVHALLSQSATRVRFAMTGSSARKLRRGDVNLLAGRALSLRCFPLVGSELGALPDIDDLLAFGGLPAIRSELDDGLRSALLEAYRDVYLVEEIRNEGLVRNLDGFRRFLDIAALMNGQVVNVATTARDAGVARTTVEGYFDVLRDTMIGFMLPAWRPRARIKETGHPKFYFFDTGVVRAISGRLGQPLESTERGHLLETWALHELRAYLHDSNAGGDISYWRTPSGVEVDFVWQRGERRVGFEVKASARWRPDDGDGLRTLSQTVGLDRSVGVYLGDQRLKDGDIEVYPLSEFVKALSNGSLGH